MILPAVSIATKATAAVSMRKTFSLRRTPAALYTDYDRIEPGSTGWCYDIDSRFQELYYARHPQVFYDMPYTLSQEEKEACHG